MPLLRGVVAAPIPPASADGAVPWWRPCPCGVTLLDATDGRVRLQAALEVTDLYRSQRGRDGLLVSGSRVDDARPIGEAGELILLHHRAAGLVALDPATWWSDAPERPRGPVIAQQPDDRTLRPVGYDADGAPRWQEERMLDDPACCWRIRAGSDPERCLLLPPEREANRVDEPDATTGETLRTLVLAGEVAEDEHLHRVARFAYVFGSGSRLVGTRGRYDLGGQGQIAALHPVPIVVSDDAVVALDPGQLGDG